ncbi:MAG: acetyl-CoA C-acetyltransferase [Desulfobacterales bacterium]
MQEAVIVSGARTAIGNFGGALKTISAVELGAQVIRQALLKINLRPVGDPRQNQWVPDKLAQQGPIDLETEAYSWADDLTPVPVDEVIMGNVLQAGQGQNPARQAMVKAGLCKETPAFTLNKVCGSGLKAIAVAAASIMSGQNEVVVAGGMENMSQVPLALPKARWGHRMELTGVGEVVDLMVWDGLYEIFYGYHMGQTAENIASLYEISRKEQDELGVLSHTRARQAISKGWFKDEIVPIAVKQRKGELIFDTDERPMDTDMEKMGRLRPAFRKEGSVTAGNASGINDAGAAVVVMSAAKAKELGLTPLATIEAFASGALDPAYMGLGPVPAIRKVLARTGMGIGDFDMIELNEAFAAQAIGCMRELNIPTDKPNEVGSGISLGHPIGCTGARQMVTALQLLKRRNCSTGLISMCIGGGMGMAMAIRRK